MMKAVHCIKYGGPEVLQILEVPELVPNNDDEIVVQIIATSATSADGRIRGLDVQGLIKFIFRLVMGWNGPRQKVLGSVFAGKVKAVGEKVTKFKVGDRVFGSLGMSTGTYTEQLIVKDSSVITLIPDNASYEEAASLLFGGLSAIYFLNKTSIESNMNVLVYGAAGAVGSMAIQILKIYGANITAVCRERHHEFILSLGANHALDYTKDEFILNENKYDVFFDAVGYLDKNRAMNMLAYNGKYITVGSLDVAKDTLENLEILADWFSSGKLKAIIDRTYSLEEIVSAHEYLDTRQKRGNIIITVGECETKENVDI